MRSVGYDGERKRIRFGSPGGWLSRSSGDLQEGLRNGGRSRGRRQKEVRAESEDWSDDSGVVLFFC